MNPDEIKKTINYWISGAEKDVSACQHLYDNEDYSQCLFWCHLILEKLLKAHVVKHTGEQAPYIHNLVQLADNTGLEFSNEQKLQLAEINEFNTMGRYPDETVSFIKK